MQPNDDFQLTFYYFKATSRLRRCPLNPKQCLTVLYNLVVRFRIKLNTAVDYFSACCSSRQHWPNIESDTLTFLYFRRRCIFVVISLNPTKA